MTNKLAKKTIATIERALEEEQTTAISEIIQLIQELASKAFSISVAELSQLIGRDSTITAKVISAANTLGFNPGGTQITTITEAIHTVGFEKIRNLAISILLVENAGQRLNPYEQREIAALSVCSGLMAQQFMERNSSSLDPELAFVCSSLRNYGKLLMTAFLIDEYREARSLALELHNDDEAFNQVFGVTPLALGQYLLQSTNLPKSIMNSLKAIPPEVLKRAVETPEDEVVVIAEFCVKVCEVAFDEKITPDQFNDAIMDVVNTFNKSIPVSLEMVNESLTEIDMNLQMFNRAVGVSDLTSPATGKIRSRVTGEELPPRPSEAEIKARKKPKHVSEMDEDERDEHAEACYQKAIEMITSKLEPGEKVNLTEIYTVAAQSIMDGLDLEDCFIFVNEDFEPDSYSARFGFGKLFERIRNRPLVSKGKKDVFGICLIKREDILIQDTNVGKIASVIPDWVTMNKEVSSLIVLPVKTDDNLFALIVGAVTGDRSIILKEGDLRRMKMMRVHLATLKRMIDDKEIKAS